MLTHEEYLRLYGTLPLERIEELMDELEEQREKFQSEIGHLVFEMYEFKKNHLDAIEKRLSKLAFDFEEVNDDIRCEVIGIQDNEVSEAKMTFAYLIDELEMAKEII